MSSADDLVPKAVTEVRAEAERGSANVVELPEEVVAKVAAVLHAVIVPFQREKAIEACEEAKRYREVTADSARRWRELAVAFGERGYREEAIDAEERAQENDREVKGALVDAVFNCALAGVPLPEWASDAFRDAYFSVKVEPLHASWDAVFGRPHRKGENLPAKRKRHKLRLKVLVAVSDLRAQMPNKNHFPEVAAKLGLGADDCKAIFYETIKFLTPTDARDTLRVEKLLDEMITAGRAALKSRSSAV
jgi:hypothetical protein